MREELYYFDDNNNNKNNDINNNNNNIDTQDLKYGVNTILPAKSLLNLL